MEFSNSIDDPRNKSGRVRSWYLYEQFKSLERNQLDAAQKLKDKSYQERVLRQELNERRARRRLCDQFGLCQSESRLGRSVSNIPSKTLLSASADDFYECFCKLQADDAEIDDISSYDGSRSSKTYQECKATEVNNDISNVESVTSVVQNIEYDDNLTDNIKEDLQVIQRNIVENINLQLETVKENIECIERCTKLCDSDKHFEGDNFNSIEADANRVKASEGDLDREYKSNVYSVLTVWSKLVEFSYRNMQLNLGNCYNDYGTQLLIAILACDIFRRALSKMCYVLQPYISPIKFAPSESEIVSNNCKNIKEIYENCKKRKTKAKLFTHQCIHKYKRNHSSTGYIMNERKPRRMSEPWHSIARITNSPENSSSSIWPDDFKTKTSIKSNCKCHKIKGMVNSMLQLSRHLDDILRDVQSVN